MKKFLLVIGMISLMLTSCGKKTDIPEQVHESDVSFTESFTDSETEKEKYYSASDSAEYPDISEQDNDSNNIGEAYYKEPLPENILIDDETGLQYVKNQLLISTFIGTENAEIKDIIEEINAEIVGYIELTGDYQIEFKEDKTLKELDKIADYINSYPFISNVTLNLVYADAEEAAP